MNVNLKTIWRQQQHLTATHTSFVFDSIAERRTAYLFLVDFFFSSFLSSPIYFAFLLTDPSLIRSDDDFVDISSFDFCFFCFSWKKKRIFNANASYSYAAVDYPQWKWLILFRVVDIWIAWSSDTRKMRIAFKLKIYRFFCKIIFYILQNVEKTKDM